MSRVILTDPGTIIAPNQAPWGVPMQPPGPAPMKVPTEWMQDEEEKQDASLVCHLCRPRGEAIGSAASFSEMLRQLQTTLCGEDSQWGLPIDAPHTKPTMGYCPECGRARCEKCRDAYLAMRHEHGGGDDE